MSTPRKWRKHNRDAKLREVESKRAKVFVTRDGRGRPVNSR